MASNEILVSEAGSPARTRGRIAAFVPIIVAVCGVATILLGGIRAPTAPSRITEASGIDPVITGSINGAVQVEDALRHLDD
jgi:hypothetical protein